MLSPVLEPFVTKSIAEVSTCYDSSIIRDWVVGEVFNLPAFCHSNHNQFSCCGSRQAGGLDLLLSNPQGQLSHAPATRASFTVLPRLGVGVGVGMGAALPSADRASSLTHALRASSLKLPRQGVGLLSGMPEYQCPGEVGHRDGTKRKP